MTSDGFRRLWRSLQIPDHFADRAARRLQRPARRLVVIGRASDDGQILRLAPGAARAWQRMQEAAARDGVTLLPLSAHRSVARQAGIIRRKLAAGESIERILRVVAVPGCSEHHTGRALDLGSPHALRLDAKFGRTREFRWLRRHAGRYGFVLSYPRNNPQGIVYEPWHWCWHRLPTGR
ncbi:MAG TPA: M15 family metallopeptidase [Lacunisphaera sp.]|nr:M15 family metallopeptidase [Lacunisphaera sp.]